MVRSTCCQPISGIRPVIWASIYLTFFTLLLLFKLRLRSPDSRVSAGAKAGLRARVWQHWYVENICFGAHLVSV